jgi:hypothetical protein
MSVGTLSPCNPDAKSIWPGLRLLPPALVACSLPKNLKKGGEDASMVNRTYAAPQIYLHVFTEIEQGIQQKLGFSWAP